MAEPYRGKFSRRTIVKGLGLGAIASVAPKAFAQTGQPVKLSFWTYENPETRPWLHKRIKLFTEQNPNVQVDFQWFTFGDLGKKISVGFATGTAPDGFVSQDWFMPVWPAKGLLAPLDVGRIGYKSYDAFTGDFTKAFVDGATRHGKVYGYPAWFYGFCNYLNTNHFKEVGLDPEKDWPQEVLHDLYKFIFSDPIDCWAATAPFTLARKSGRRDDPLVRQFPNVEEIITATDQGVFLPRTLVFNELADSMHRAVQKIMLTNADIQKTLDDAAAEVDRRRRVRRGRQQTAQRCRHR
jgi:ABC-type glycerol-3-phosphate transport system substrate-binding protein